MDNEILGSNGDVFIKPILNLMYDKNNKRRSTIDTIELIIKHIYITFVDFFQEFIALIACFVIITNIFIRKLLPSDIIYPSDPQKFPYVYYSGDDNSIDEEDDNIQRLITHSQLFNKESYSKYETVFDSVKVSADKEINKRKINNINDKHSKVFGEELINTIHNPSKEKLSIFASMFQNLNYEKIPSNSWPSSMFSYVLLFTVIKINDIIKIIMNYIPHIFNINDDKSYKINNTNIIIYASMIFLLKYLSSMYPIDYSNIISDSVYGDGKNERENRSTILGEILFLFLKTLESFIKPFLYILITMLIIVYVASLVYTCVAFYKYANAINRGKGSGAILMYLYSNFCMFFIITKTMMLLNEMWFTIRNSTCDDTSLFYFVRRNSAKSELNNAIKKGGIDRLKNAINTAKEYKINVNYAKKVLEYEEERKTIYENLKKVHDDNKFLITKYDNYLINNKTSFFENLDASDTNYTYTDQYEDMLYTEENFESLYCNDSFKNTSNQETLKDISGSFSNNLYDVSSNINKVTDFISEYDGKDYYRDQGKNEDNGINTLVDELKKIKIIIKNFNKLSKSIASADCSRDIYTEAAEYKDDKKSLTKKIEKKFDTNKPSIFGGASKGKQNKKYKKVSGNAERDIIDFFKQFGEFSRTGGSTILELEYQKQLQSLMSTQVSAKHAQIENNNKGKKKQKFYDKRRYYVSMHINRAKALLNRENINTDSESFNLGKLDSTDGQVYDNLRQNALFDWTLSQSVLDDGMPDSDIRKHYFQSGADYLSDENKLKDITDMSSEDVKDIFVLWTLTRDEFKDYLKWCKLSDECTGYNEYNIWNNNYRNKNKYKDKVKKECFMQRIIEGNKIIEGAEFNPSRKKSPSKCSKKKKEKEEKGVKKNFTNTFIYYMIIFPVIIPMCLPEAAALWKTVELSFSMCFGSFYQYEFSKEPFIPILGNILSLFKVKIAFFILLLSSIMNILIESSKHKYSAVKFPTILIIMLSLITGNYVSNKSTNG